MSPQRLLGCVVGYAVASPLLHHAWFALHGDKGELLQSFAVMAIGDLTGSLIVVYMMKLLVLINASPAAVSGQPSGQSNSAWLARARARSDIKIFLFPSCNLT